MHPSEPPQPSLLQAHGPGALSLPPRDAPRTPAISAALPRLPAAGGPALQTRPPQRRAGQSNAEDHAARPAGRSVQRSAVRAGAVKARRGAEAAAVAEGRGFGFRRAVALRSCGGAVPSRLVPSRRGACVGPRREQEGGEGRRKEAAARRSLSAGTKGRAGRAGQGRPAWLRRAAEPLRAGTPSPLPRGQRTFPAPLLLPLFCQPRPRPLPGRGGTSRRRSHEGRGPAAALSSSPERRAARGPRRHGAAERGHHAAEPAAGLRADPARGQRHLRRRVQGKGRPPGPGPFSRLWDGTAAPRTRRGVSRPRSERCGRCFARG